MARYCGELGAIEDIVDPSVKVPKKPEQGEHGDNTIVYKVAIEDYTNKKSMERQTQQVTGEQSTWLPPYPTSLHSQVGEAIRPIRMVGRKKRTPTSATIKNL